MEVNFYYEAGCCSLWHPRCVTHFNALLFNEHSYHIEILPVQLQIIQ